MTTINVPAREQVAPANQAIFDSLQKALGFVPNLYATFAHSDTALATYLALQNAKSSLSGREREVINLVVSQVNHCRYCLAAHTALGKMHGFTDEQIIQIRRANIDFDPKLAALAAFVKQVAVARGHDSEAARTTFFAAGYSKANLIDTLMVVGDKIISNYLHSVTDIPVDFPAAIDIDD
ncbi:carboxymuconolactone decarboxylase family protein [Aquitalea palustris]|uniref:Carboxymuconolactone decarboxylase family protein n=1 Tax=Aquitalea palustris TaxID=2480983 RepID=A0A454JLU0_9NEIS|nr:carboxymuconolactone decarboxylase family protein [Aquitalea palustris]RMD00872.1 carboxymuconolactone decarboxylase family protein [Aquitalea palustris]